MMKRRLICRTITKASRYFTQRVGEEQMPACFIVRMDEPSIGRELARFNSSVMQVHTAAKPLYFGQKPRVLQIVHGYGLEDLGQTCNGRGEQDRTCRPEFTGPQHHAPAILGSKNPTHWTNFIKPPPRFSRE